MSDLPFAKKSLGQHWLTDQTSLQAMVTAAQVEADDTVLEIGPGVGTLTRELIGIVKQVVAVEFDSALAKALPSVVPADNLQVVESDILRFDYTALPPDYKVVANIPYYLTSNLIRQLSETSNQPRTAALLVQKEVAQRVAAKPGDMSLLSVTAQYYWNVSVGMLVPAKLFTPPPKVDSQILILERRDGPLFDDVDVRRFFRLVKAGFSERRKTLLNSLSGGLRLDKPTVQNLLDASGIEARLRPQNLSLENWHDIYKNAIIQVDGAEF
ncbi:MAG: putative Ribosomal small subunit methyltransferase [Candidatus Saccharibacteria bacterium]|nr:putative Ribosomal small subunit methyltransferase [Candidatus Saccharibacteria bacterium]